MGEEANVHARRYAKACDACHRKKIKCVVQGDTCELCEKTGQQCKFTRIEKALPKRPQRGKYLVALESRLKNMEKLLQRSQSREKPAEEEEKPKPEQPILNDEHLATIISRGGVSQPKRSQERRELRLPPKFEATHLAVGYFACSNHVFPIFAKGIFMHRLNEEYPPEKHKDLLWWAEVVTVLCYAHRLRAMSKPMEAERENEEASRYLKELLDIAPKLTYGKPSIGSAQVLLGLASILRGTAMPDAAPMLVSAAIRMLQQLDVHKHEPLEMTDCCAQKERERVFWVAYILDKDNALQTRGPPVLHERDIGRQALPDREEDGVGTFISLDSLLEVNLFAASQRLAWIQGQVWDRVHSAVAAGNRAALEAAQRELNPMLVAWKNALPFEFKRESLAGHWPKRAIVHIVVLHFRYFQTVVELNKVPPSDDDSGPLQGDCPIAKSLPSYPHSTAPVAVEAARDALDLACLTPRGNFQNVWLFFHFSISAVLTLCVNGIIRPLEDQHNVAEDVRRVDAWIGVIDLLATSSDRADLLEKKEFVLHMRTWTLHVLQSSISGEESPESNYPCLQRIVKKNSDLRRQTDILPQYQMQQGDNMSESLLFMPNVRHVTPDIFPIGMLQSDDWAAYNKAAQGIMSWTY